MDTDAHRPTSHTTDALPPPREPADDAGRPTPAPRRAPATEDGHGAAPGAQAGNGIVPAPQAGNVSVQRPQSGNGIVPGRPAGNGAGRAPQPDADASRRVPPAAPPMPTTAPRPPDASDRRPGALPGMPPRPESAPRIGSARTSGSDGATGPRPAPEVGGRPRAGHSDGTTDPADGVPPRPEGAPRTGAFDGLLPRPGTAPRTGRPDGASEPADGVPPRPEGAPRIGSARTSASGATTGPVGGPRTAPAGAAPAGAAPVGGLPPRPGAAPRTVAPVQAARGQVGDVPAVETTTRLRPIRDAALVTAPPRQGQTYGMYGAYRPATAPPETPAEITTQLRPIRERRVGRGVAAGACLVLGVGLVGGALAGAVLAATDVGAPPEPAGFAEARTLWHSVPVDTLFPRTLAGPGEGPGAADRTWTRVVVAADTPCTPAVLPKSVLTALRPVGCERVLRATYTDATGTSVITVGLVFTQADPTATRALAAAPSAADLGADVPPALAAPGTSAARFGAGQRASWSTRALTDLPVVVTAVSGFADGRPVAAPEPADRAMADGQTTPAAQAGLGHEAKGVADRIERALRATVTTAAKEGDDR